MVKKLNITSSALEKGLDIAKDFLDKLIIPAVEETGLLLKDKVTLWKFKNQVKILNEAKKYCEKNNISTKTISLKILCPLLDNAALEEDEILQNKWAILLANLVDTEQNIQNHVFPYILSQISLNEFSILEKTATAKDFRTNQLKTELIDYRMHRIENEKKLKNEIFNIEKEIKTKIQNQFSYHELENRIWSLDRELDRFKKKEEILIQSIEVPEILVEGLKQYEISNLDRLGLIKTIQRAYGYIKSHPIRKDFMGQHTIEDATVEIEPDYEEYLLTELGELFINACSERKK